MNSSICYPFSRFHLKNQLGLRLSQSLHLNDHQPKYPHNSQTRTLKRGGDEPIMEFHCQVKGYIMPVMFSTSTFVNLKPAKLRGTCFDLTPDLAQQSDDLRTDLKVFQIRRFGDNFHCCISLFVLKTLKFERTDL